MNLEQHQYQIDNVAKIICLINGDNPRLKHNIGNEYNKKLIPLWQTYRIAAEMAIKYGCTAYMNGNR